MFIFTTMRVEMDENFKTYIKPFIEYEKLKVGGEEGNSKIMFDQYIKWVYYHGGKM